MKNKIGYIFLLFSSIELVLGGMHVRTFVRQSPPPASSSAGHNDTTCAASTCLDDDDCTSLDANMKCFYEYCSCKTGYTREGNTCRERGKKIGEACGASDDCVDVNGYCDPDTDQCACSSTYKEWNSACYKGYKGSLGNSLDISVEGLTKLPFCVSVVNQSFQLLFTDVDEEHGSFRFYEDNSYTSESVDYESLELEIVLNGAPSGGVVSPTNVDCWMVSWGDDDFTLKIYDYESDGTLNEPPLSTNNKERFKLDPEILTLTREDGTQDFIFYPLSLKCTLVSSGDLGDPCSADDDCKIYHSVCVDSRCECEDGYANDNYYCIPAAQDIGDHCASTSQCSIPHSICVDEECACAEGYYKDVNGTCSDDWKSVGENCTSSDECEDKHTVCDKTCKCKASYTEVNGKCYKAAAVGEPCSCSEQCTNPNSYCKLDQGGSRELGECACLPTTCEYQGVCYKGYIVYPTTTDVGNTYSGRRFDTTSMSSLSYKLVPAAAAPGEFHVYLSTVSDTQRFDFNLQAVAAGSTGKIVYGVSSQGPDPITVVDPSANFLTHLSVSLPSSTVITEDSSGATSTPISLSGGLGTFDEVTVEVDPDSLSALRFCPLSSDVTPEGGESGDSCLPDEGCPDVSNAHCNFKQICECDDGYVDFYGQCIAKVPLGGDCVTLLQCINSFCRVSGKCE